MDVISQNIVYFIIAIAILVALLAWAYATRRIQKEFSTMTWVLIPVGIAINGVLGYIVGQLKLPVFLDSIGTVLVAVLCGPWAGALTGALSNFVIGILTNPTDWWPWIPVAFFIGLVAGLCANAGLFKSWWKVVVTGFNSTHCRDHFYAHCRVFFRRHYIQRFFVYYCLLTPNWAGYYTSCFQHKFPG